jgi:hypothetical protein
VTPQVFVAILLAFVAGLATGSPLLLYAFFMRAARSPSFRQGALSVLLQSDRTLLHLHELPCPLCGSGPVQGPEERPDDER